MSNSKLNIRKPNKRNTKMRTCTKCNIEKPKSEFGKQTKGRDGLKSYCKTCIRAYNKVLRDKVKGDYEYIIENRWKSINQRCQNGVWSNSPSIMFSPQMTSYRNKPQRVVNITKEEFVNWMLSVEKIHDKIVASGDVSSIDRIDDTRGYELGNLQLISRHENIEKRFGKPCKFLDVAELDRKSRNNQRKYQTAKQNYFDSITK